MFFSCKKRTKRTLNRIPSIGTGTSAPEPRSCGLPHTLQEKNKRTLNRIPSIGTGTSAPGPQGCGLPHTLQEKNKRILNKNPMQEYSCMGFLLGISSVPSLQRRNKKDQAVSFRVRESSSIPWWVFPQLSFHWPVMVTSSWERTAICSSSARPSIGTSE